jgi:hypothetical protein
MEPVGLAFGALGTAALCLKFVNFIFAISVIHCITVIRHGCIRQNHLQRSLSEPPLTSLRFGNELIERYRVWKNAATILEDHFLGVENRWLKIQTQIEFLRSIWKYGV